MSDLSQNSLKVVMRDYIREVLSLEGGLEVIKRDLAVRKDFTLEAVFNMFTGYTTARISPNDMLYGLERLGVVCDIADAKLIIERFD